MEGSRFVVIPGSFDSSSVHQQLDSLRVAGTCSQVESRLSVRIFGVRIRSFVQQ